MYYNGEGTAVDKDKARMWYEKAAAQEIRKVAMLNARQALQKKF